MDWHSRAKLVGSNRPRLLRHALDRPRVRLARWYPPMPAQIIAIGRPSPRPAKSSFNSWATRSSDRVTLTRNWEDPTVWAAVSVRARVPLRWRQTCSRIQWARSQVPGVPSMPGERNVRLPTGLHTSIHLTLSPSARDDLLPQATTPCRAPSCRAAVRQFRSRRARRDRARSQTVAHEHIHARRVDQQHERYSCAVPQRQTQTHGACTPSEIHGPPSLTRKPTPRTV